MSTTAYAGIDGHLNFNIPKVKRKLTKDNLTSVELDSRDAREIISAMHRSYLEPKFSTPWTLQAVDIIVNKQLEEIYRLKKLEMREEGRHSKDVTDQFVYLACKDPFLSNTIAKNGIQAFEKKDKILNALGNSKSGVSLWKHADVQLSVAETFPVVSVCKFLVFKVVLGKCKPVQPCYSPETVIDPTPNYDCHISAISPKIGDPFYPKLMKSQIFFYEYTEDALPSTSPRQCLPYAVLTFSRPKESAPQDLSPLKTAYNNFFRSFRAPNPATQAIQTLSSAVDNSALGRGSYLNRPLPAALRFGATETGIPSTEAQLPDTGHPGQSHVSYRAYDQQKNTNLTSCEGQWKVPPHQPVVGLSGQNQAPLCQPKQALLHTPGQLGTNIQAPGSNYGSRPVLQDPRRSLLPVPQQVARQVPNAPLAASNVRPLTNDPRLARRSSQNAPSETGQQQTPGSGTAQFQYSACEYPSSSDGEDALSGQAKGLKLGNTKDVSSPDPKMLNKTPQAVSPVALHSVQQSLTDSHMAMLKQALSISQLSAATPQLGSPDINAVPATASGPPVNFGVGSVQQAGHDVGPKLKTGKQKLSLESYRLMKRRGSSQPNQSPQESSTQPSVLVNPPTTPSELATRDGEAAPVVDSVSNVDTKPPVIASPVLKSKGILKTDGAEMDQENPSESPIKDLKLIVKTETVMPDEEKSYVDALTSEDGLMDRTREGSPVIERKLFGRISRPGTPLSSTSSTCSVDSGSVHSSLANSPSAGQTQVKPAQKKKKVNRIMIGYKKRRRKKKGKAKGKAVQEEAMIKIEDIKQEIDDSPEKVHLTAPEKELTERKNPLPEKELTEGKSPLPEKELTERKNPLWELSSPVNDNEIEYNDFDFSFDLPHFFESSPVKADPSTADCESSIQPRQFTPHLSLQSFGLLHWSQALADLRFQPKVRLGKIQVETEDDPEEPMTSDYEVEEEKLVSIADPSLNDKPKEGLVKEKEDIPSCSDMDISEIEESPMIEINVKTPVVPDIITPSDSVSRNLNKSWDEVAAPTSLDRRLEVKEEMPDFGLSASFGQTPPKKPSLGSILCDLSEIDAAIDRDMKMNKNLYSFPKIDFDFSRFNVKPKKTTEANQTDDQEVKTQEELDRAVSMEAIHKVAVNILPYMKGKSAMSMEEISATIASILGPPPVAETVEPSDSPQTNVVLEELDTTSTFLWPQSPEESDPMEHENTASEIPLVRESSPEEPLVSHTTGQVESPAENPAATPGPTGSESPVTLMPASSTTYDALYSAYSPQRHEQAFAESAEQTAAKWFSQMAQMCNVQNKDVEKENKDFFEAVKTTLNMNLTLKKPLPQKQISTTTDEGKVESCITKKMVLETKTPLASAVVKVEAKPIVKSEVKHTETSEAPSQPIQKEEKIDNKAKIKARRKLKKLRKREKKLKQEKLKEQKLKEEILKELQLKELQLKIKEEKEERGVVTVTASTLTQGNQERLVVDNRMTMELKSPLEPSNSFEKLRSLKQAKPVTKQIKEDKINSASMTGITEQSGQTDILKWFEDMIKPKQDGQSAVNKPTLNLSSVDQTLKKGPRRSSCSPFRRPRRSRSSSRFSNDSRSRSSSRNSLERYPRYKRSTSRSPRRYERRPSRDTTSVSSGMSRFSERSRDRRRRSSSFSSSDRSRSRSPFRRRRSYSPKRPLTLQSSWSPPRGSLNSWSWWEKKWPREGKSPSRSPRRHSSLSRNRSSRSRSPRYKPIRDRKSRSRSPKRRNSSNLSAGSRSPKRIRSNNSRSKSSSPRRKSPSRRDKRSRSRSPRRKRRKSGSRSPKRNKSRSRSPTRYGLRDKKSRSRSPQSKRRQSRSKSTTRSLSKDNKVQSSMDRRTVSVGKKSRSGSPVRKLAGRPRSRSRSPGKKVEKNRKSRSKSPSRRYDKALGPSEDKKARSKNDKKSRSGSPKCQGKGPRSQSPRNSENRFKKYRSPSPRKRPLSKNTDHKHPVKTSDPENLQRYCRRETKSHSRSPKDKKSNSSTQRLNDVNSVDKNSGSGSANISSDKKLQPESSNCSATDVKEKDLPDSRRKSCFSSFEKTAVEISKPNVHVIENILTDRMVDVKMANEVVSGPNKASDVPAVMCEMKSPACASPEDIISVKEMMFEELCHKKTRQQSGQSKTSDKDGAEVEFPGATTLDDLASERERLLSELCGLNSGSDCESVSSLLSNGSINKTIDKKLRKSQVCQLVSRSPSHVPEYDVQNIVLLNEALGMGSIKSVSTHNVEYPLSSSSLYSERGLLNDPAYGNKAKDFVARNLSSNDNWNLGTDDFCESQLQKPQVRQVGATWGAIVSNIHKEKQEVIRGCGTIDGPAIKPEMDQLKSGEEPTVTDPFAEECRIALAKIEKTKRRSNHELHSGPLNAWLSLILPKDNKSYDLVLTRICKSLQLKPSEKFCDLGKGKKKEVRSTAERLARLVKDMEESTYYEIILPPLHCPDCCTKTVGQWLAMGINSSTPLYQSFLKEVCLSAGVPEYIKVTALSKVASEKLMESVRDCCGLLQKLGRQGDSETHSDTTANTESVKISESTTTNFQAPELHGAEKVTDKTLLSISRNICNSCGRNSEHLGLTFAVNRLKEIKPLVTKASLFFKEYVKHMKVVLWNAKVFKTVRFKLDQALSMLNAVNSLSQAVKRHFSCLVPASENVAKVLFMSKFLYFKRHQAKVNLVISYIDSAERLICEALDRATVQHNAMKVEMEGASEDILSCSECLKYIHGSACPEKTPDFISLDPADACVTKPGPTTTATGFGNSEECSTIATMQTECTREQVPPEVMALFGQMQKSLEMSDGDCKLKGTGKYEKISDDLLLPTEIENGVLYGGRCLYLRRNLRDKVAQQLARCKSNILRINECLSRRPDPTQEKAKVRMLNLRWNLLTRYTFKLNPEKSGRPGLLQKEAQVLEQCLEWHGKSGFPEIEAYQTDPILELIKTHLERIDTAIQLVETGLAKMRSEKASSLFPGSLCQGEGGLVSGSETDCLSSSSLLSDQTDNPDPSSHKVGGTQYSEMDKRECAILGQSDSNDGSGIQITYFASKYDVLEPSEFHSNSSAAFQTCGDTRRSLIIDQGDQSPADSCGWNEDRRTAVAVGADTRTIVAYDDDSAELHSRQQCPSSSIPCSGRNEQWGGNPIATMCSRRPVNQSCYTGNARQRNFKGNQGWRIMR